MMKNRKQTNWSDVFPIAGWMKQYQRAWLPQDIFAGVTVGVMLIPQGMAYAMIAGLPPVYGLYASILPQIVYAIFGTSRQLSVAPSAMDSLLVASGVGVLALQGTDAYIAFAIMLALMVGLFQFSLGVFKMGFITNLLSKPVITGFTSAAAVIIGINQFKHLLGINMAKSSQIIELVKSLLANIAEIHWMTMIVGVGSVVVVKLSKKINKRLPGALIAVVFGIVVVFVLGLDHQGVSIVKEIPSGLPTFAWPDLNIDVFLKMLPLSLTISLVAFMEGFSVAKALESQKKDHKVKPNKELIALGLSNLIGALFQSYPVTGGFSRSAVNAQSGAQTPLSSVFSAVVVGITLLFLTPLFYYLPHAALAGIILVGVIGLVDISFIRKLYHDSKIEFTLLAITFIVTLYFGMVQGIISGISFSILYVLYKAAYPHIAELGRVQGHHEFRNVKRFDSLEKWSDRLTLRIDAPLTFINIQYFRDFVLRSLEQNKEKVQFVIVDAGPVSHIDATAIAGLAELITELKNNQITFIICDVVGPVRDTLADTGLLEIIGREFVFLNLNESIKYLETHQEGAFRAFALQSNHHS